MKSTVLLYSDFRLSIIMNNFHTKYIAVENGVLRGDSIDFLSDHTQLYTILYVKEEKFTNFG